MLLSNLTLLRPCLLILAFGASALQAQTEIPVALKQAEADLKQALTELEKTRQGIAAEKPKLTADFRKPNRIC